MPQKQYLSTDPNAGDEPSKAYLSTDPNAGDDPKAGITTGPNPETPGQMLGRNVSDFFAPVTGTLSGLYSLYKDPKGTLSSMGQGLAENINKSVASDAVEKRGEEPKHSLGTDLGIVASLGATQLPVGRILGTVRAGASDAPNIIPGVKAARQYWRESAPSAPKPPAAVKLGEHERIMGPSTMPGGPQGRATPPPAATVEPVPFHERPLYQQMDDLPQTEAPILGRGADPPYQPTPTTAPKPTGPPPILRKATQTPEEILNQKLREGMQAEAPPSGTTPPEPTITPSGREGEFFSSGRPAVTAEGQAATEAAGAGRVQPRETPPPTTTPSATGGNAAREAELEQALWNEIDTAGTNKMGTSRAKVNELDRRAGPKGLPLNELKRITEKVASQTPAERIAYYKTMRDDIFRHEYGRAMERAGTPIPE